MKKVLFFSVILIIGSLLIGCTPQGKPSNTSQQMYDSGLRALAVTDAYLNGEIEVIHLVAYFNGAHEYLISLIQLGTYEGTHDIASIPYSEYSHDRIIDDNVHNLARHAQLRFIGTSRNNDGIKLMRNELAKSLNEKSR